jgi:hypothetical protein
MYTVFFLLIVDCFNNWNIHLTRDSIYKVPDQIKQKDNFNSFKKGLRSFLLKHSFYSVDEFMSFKVLSV